MLFTAEAPGEIGLPGFNSVVKVAVILPFTSFTAATSQISSPYLALSPVVSKSMITKVVFSI